MEAQSRQSWKPKQEIDGLQSRDAYNAKPWAFQSPKNVLYIDFGGVLYSLTDPGKRSTKDSTKP